MNTTEPRFNVYDRKTGPLSRFSAVNPRYWVIDSMTGLMVDEFTTKANATAEARIMNREAQS